VIAGPRQALVVYNPNSGTTGDLDRRLGVIVRRLSEHCQYVVNVRPLCAGMSSQDLLSEELGRFELVVACGGDGTIGTVLGAVAECACDVPVGIVPFGTGNLLARSLNIYPERFSGDILEHAMDIIMSGNVTSIDLGRMNGQWFAVDAGVGPISDAVTAPRQADKRTWKLLAYGGPLLESITRPSMVFTIKADDEKPYDILAAGIFVTNTSEMGIGKRLDLQQLQDGVLDLCILRPFTLHDYWHLTLRIVGWFLFGQMWGSPVYLVKKVKRATIEVAPRVPRASRFQKFSRAIYNYLHNRSNAPQPRKNVAPTMVEGDRCGQTPMYVEVVPQAVKIIVPIICSTTEEKVSALRNER
jgi:diacylglycerol kinase (ATP)